MDEKTPARKAGGVFYALGSGQIALFFTIPPAESQRRKPFRHASAFDRFPCGDSLFNGSGFPKSKRPEETADEDPPVEKQGKGESMRRRRGQIILLFLALWLMAVSLPNLYFAPGHWEPLKSPSLPDLPPGWIFFLFLLSIGAILLGIFILGFWRQRRGRKKDPEMVPYSENPSMPWPAAISLLLFLFSLGILAWWTWHHYLEGLDPFSGLRAPMESSSPKPPAPPQHEAPPIPPSAPSPGLFDWPIPWIAGAGLALFILAITLHQALARRGSQGLEMKDAHLSDLSAIQHRDFPAFTEGLDLDEPIFRCYRDMCAILRSKVSFRSEMTAREFARALEEEGVHDPAIRRLTGIFERVRYGRHSPQAQERSEAIHLLGQIEALYGRRADET